MKKNYKVAFFFYGYNLAETTRAIEVATSLRAKNVEIEFFSHGGPHSHRPEEVGFKHNLMLPEITEKQHKRFLDIDQGRIRGEVYSIQEWVDFAKSEIEALQNFRFQAVYAGFNLPTVISARATGVKLIYLIPTQGIQTYYAKKLGTFPEFLENSFTSFIPASWKNVLFNKIMTTFNYLPIDNLNEAAKIVGAKPLVSAFEVLSGDLVLLSDLEEMTGLPSKELPKNHFYTGALFANLPVEVPVEVKKIFSGEGFKIFCAMGSSGSPEVLRTAINALKKTNYKVVAATTSIMDPKEFEPFNDRFYVTRYLPATAVNEMCDLAITHGGQGTLQNSIWAGKPIIGVPFQFEQQSNLDMVERAGVGIKIPMKEYTEKRILAEIERIRQNPEFQRKTEELSKKFRLQDGKENAAKIILEFLSKL